MKKKWGYAAVIAVVIAAGGGFAVYQSLTGNHVEIKDVIADSEAEAASGNVVTADQLNGEWSISTGSEVYLSLTTSKETVNMTVGTVKGKWVIDTDNAQQVTAEGTVEVSGLDSGNSMRDGHIKGENFLNATAFPEASFKATSIEGFPDTWNEGVAVPLKLSGTLTVRGIDKDVVFDSQAVYEQGQVKLKGSTVVKFADYGMENPHQVLVETQNDVTVQLQLILDKPKV